MMSYSIEWNFSTASWKSTNTCWTLAVSALPLVPPTSTRSSLLNWSTVCVRSRMSWHRSRKESRRAKSALFWKRQGFCGVSAFVLDL